MQGHGHLAWREEGYRELGVEEQIPVLAAARQRDRHLVPQILVPPLTTCS